MGQSSIAPSPLVGLRILKIENSKSTFTSNLRFGRNSSREETVRNAQDTACIICLRACNGSSSCANHRHQYNGRHRYHWYTKRNNFCNSRRNSHNRNSGSDAGNRIGNRNWFGNHRNAECNRHYNDNSFPNDYDNSFADHHNNTFSDHHHHAESERGSNTRNRGKCSVDHWRRWNDINRRWPLQHLRYDNWRGQHLKFDGGERHDFEYRHGHSVFAFNNCQRRDDTRHFQHGCDALHARE